MQVHVCRPRRAIPIGRKWLHWYIGTYVCTCTLVWDRSVSEQTALLCGDLGATVLATGGITTLGI